MSLDTYAIMCGISAHAIAEAKRPASFLEYDLILLACKYRSCGMGDVLGAP